MPDLVGSRSIFTTGDTPMRLTCLAAAFAAAASSIAPAQAGGEWPDGPNKAWFEKLQRPDNHLAPYRNIDPKSLFCCGIAERIALGHAQPKAEKPAETAPSSLWRWLRSTG